MTLFQTRPSAPASTRFPRAHSPIPVLLLGGLALIASISCQKAPMEIDEIESLQAAGRYERTIDPLREALQSAPEDTQLQFLYGRALFATNRPGLSVWALKGAMHDPEYQVPAGRMLINTLIMGEAWSDAEAICNEILDSVGENKDILTLRAYARQGSRQNYEGAIEDADRVLELDPENREVLIPRTVALLALKRVEEAGEALEYLDELYRDEAHGLKGSGKFCTAGATFALEKGDPELALERFDRCLEEFPTNAILLAKAIEFFDARREFSRSIEILQNSLAEQPIDPQVRENLAARLEVAGRHEEAERLLLDATQHESVVAQVQAWSMLASFYASTGRPDKSVDAYEQARARLTTRSPDLDFRYADILIHVGRYEDALAFADELTVPSHRLLIRGRAMLALDRPERALEELSEANRLWPNNAVARYYTAVAAEQTADLDRAIEEYRYSVRIDSSATDAPLRLAGYYVALGEGPRAVSTLSLGKETHPNAVEMQLRMARIMAYRGAGKEIPKRLAAAMATPAYRVQTAAAIADGIRDREGSTAAVQFLERFDQLDLRAPRNVPALTRLVEWLPEIERTQEALDLAQAARDAVPTDATFQALFAAALHRTVSPSPHTASPTDLPEESDLAEASTANAPESARESEDADLERVAAGYERALELDANEVVALRGLADLLVETGQDGERAVSLYRRAIEQAPQDDRASLGLARYLDSRGRSQEALEVLTDLLDRRPWDPEVSLRVAEALLEIDAQGNRARAEERLAWARKLRRAPGNHKPLFDSVSQRLDASS